MQLAKLRRGLKQSGLVLRTPAWPGKRHIGNSAVEGSLRKPGSEITVVCAIIDTSSSEVMLARP